MGKRGSCYLCGEEDIPLTKDHLQPQCAFNEKHRRYTRLQSDHLPTPKNAPWGKKFNGTYYEIQPDKPIEGGIYRMTQCATCNGLLGGCYDPHFGEFCHDAVANMKLGEIRVIQDRYTQTIRYPLSLLKRILAMFFSINGSNFVRKNAELSQFIRQPENRDLPEKYRLFVGYNANDMVSHIPFQIRTNSRFSFKHALTQIAHPPFVYVLTFSDHCPDSRLVEFTGFKEIPYGERADIDCVFRLLPTNNCFAGDFRSEGKMIPDDMAIFCPEIQPSYFRLVDVVI
jgi:hypothetical protein